MGSQQLLDLLTAHIALYHSASSSSSSSSAGPNPNPRSAVLRWFSALSAPHRRSVLTTVDSDFVRVLLLMLSRLRSPGAAHARFFLLPDLPNSSAPSLPSLCFRRSEGLLARAAGADPHAGALARSLLLFSSSHETDLDSATVSEDLVENVDHFVEIMDGISGGRFLKGDEAAAELEKPWAELPWLRDKGYYGIEAFVANKLEVALRLSWFNSTGLKKQKGSRGKEKERAAEVAGVAANAFWRKKGCVDWWMGLDASCRKDFFAAFLGKAAKSLAKQVAKESEIDLSYKTCSFDTESECLIRDGLTASHLLFKRETTFLSDTIPLRSSVMPYAIPDYMKSLIAIQEMSAMFLACQHQDFEKDILFFSTLDSVHTVSDFIFRKLRAVIMMVSVDIIKAELMGDEKLKTLPHKIGGKFVQGQRRGKNKCRKPKNLNLLPKPSKCDLELQEKFQDNGSGTHFVQDNGFSLCSELNTHATMTNGKKRIDSPCGVMQNDPGKEGGTCVVDSKDHTNKKKGRKKGGKSKTSSLKEAIKFQNPEPVNCTTDNSSFGIENEPAKPVGSIGASSMDLLSNNLVAGDDLSLGYSCSVSDHPVALDDTEINKNTRADNILYCTTDSCLSKKKSGDGDVHNHVSSCLVKDEGIKPVTSLCLVPTKYCCDKLIGDCVDTSVRLSSGVTSCGGIYGPARDLENATSKKVPAHHISPSISCSISQPVAPRNLLQSAINNQSTVIQSASRDCYVYDNSTSNGGPSYEWPIIAPFNFTSVNSRHLPPATDRLHLDVGHSWPNHLRQSYLSSSQQARTSIEGGCGKVLPSLTLPMSYDWPPLVKSCSRLSQSVTVGYDSGYTSRLQTAFSGFSAPGVQINGNSNENNMMHSGDYMDAHDSKIASELADETEGYWLSEEEYEAHAFSGQDYNQVFGGGVMYWNPTEYVGTGFSRPPSYSSEDSSWAWREADLNRAIDDMVGMPGLPASYNTNGLSSPPAAPFCSPFDPLVGSGHQSVGYAMPGNDVAVQILHSSSSILDGHEEKLSRSLNSGSGGVEGMKGDTLPYQRLRPIVVPSISRKGSRSDFKLSRDHKSPCLPSSIRDPPQIKRPPSPVVLCVPRVPRPPPPSPVGESRKRGFPSVRSGSSSPRHWGMRNWYHEEGHSEETSLPLDGTELVWPSWGKKNINATPMVQSIQDSMLQNHLMTISQIPHDQEHPDVALPVQRADIQNSPFHKTSLSTLHNLLHEEIDRFCKQVAAENLIRKPYINWAVKRVTRSLQVLWPRSRTNIFGSNAMGLALPTSDVDLVVSLPPVRNLEPIKEAGILEGRNGIKETCLQHAARYLANQEWVRNDSLKTIENTAIPVIMLVAEVPHEVISSNGTSSTVDTTGSQSINTPNEQNIVSHAHVCGSEDNSIPSCSNMTKDDPTNVKSIHLDISFKSPSHTGLQTSELVGELTQQFPASVPLALVLKQFLADRSLDRSYSGGLSSYCLMLMITRFLQHEHHIGRPINQNLGGLLMDFLYFFGNVFDPRQMRISIHGSGVYMKRERGLSIDPIHIDDPLHPMNNVGRNCFRIHQCVKAFADAYSVLENELSQLSCDCGTASKPCFRILPKIIPSIDHEE